MTKYRSSELELTDNELDILIEMIASSEHMTKELKQSIKDYSELDGE